MSAVLEREIIAAVSAARTDPKSLAEQIRSRRAHFKGKEYYPPERGGKIAVPSKEGTRAIDEALTFLSSFESGDKDCPTAIEEPGDATALEALKLSAEDHLVDRGTLGRIGHRGSDGSSAIDRQNRYGSWSGSCGECLWFGREGVSAATIVQDLVIDDGVASRGHRLCIFDPSYQVAAARVGDHAAFGAMAVIEFAAAFEPDKPEELAARRMGGAPKPLADAAADEGEHTSWSKVLGKCAGCKQTIKGGAVVDVKGLGKYHKACFACASCSTPLVGTAYIVADGCPHCKPCHVQLHAPTCATCGEKIAGGGITVGGTPYHKECKPVQAPAAAPARGAPGGPTAGKKKASSGSLKPKPPLDPSIAGARRGIGGLVADYSGLE